MSGRVPETTTPSLLKEALEAFEVVAASDTNLSPKSDEDYVQAVIDAVLGHNEPLEGL